MIKIYKYPFGLLTGPAVTLDLPFGAIVLKVAEQNEMITLWAEVDPELDTIKRTFIIRGTGHEVPEGQLEYLDSVFIRGYVWHIYEAL